jgi:hypothetical protein
VFHDASPSIGVATVIVTSGNHDSAIRLSYGLGLFRDRIRMITYPARLDLPVQLEGSDGVRAMVYGVHYLGRGRPRVALADGDKPPPRSHQAVLAKRSPWTASTVRSLQPPSVPLRGPTNPERSTTQRCRCRTA